MAKKNKYMKQCEREKKEKEKQERERQKEECKYEKWKKKIKKWEDEKKLKPLLKLIHPENNCSDDIKREAIFAIRGIGDSSALEPLLKLILPKNDCSIYIKSSAIYAIGKIGDRSALEPLLKLIHPKTDIDDYVKKEAIEALGKIGDRSTLESLLLMLESKDEGIQIATLSALKEIGDKRAIEPIVKFLDDKSTDSALKEIKDKSAIERQLKKYEQDGKAKERIEVLIEAACTLCKLGYVQIVEPLTKLCEALDDPPFNRIAKLLKNSLGELAVDQLITAQRKNIYWRYPIDFLGIIGDKRALSFFHEALNDESFFFREYVLEAIYKMEGKQAFSVALKSLNDNTMCETAIKILGKITDERAVEPLIELADNLKDLYRLETKKEKSKRNRYPEIKFSKRFAIYDALAEIGGERVTNYFLSLLGTCFEKAAAIRLAKLQDKGAVGSLVRLLCHGEDEITSAFEMLNEENRQYAIDKLIEKLGYKEQKNREPIIYILGKIGDERAANALINCEIHGMDESLARDHALINLGKKPLRYDAGW